MNRRSHKYGGDRNTIGVFDRSTKIGREFRGHIQRLTRTTRLVVIGVAAVGGVETV